MVFVFLCSPSSKVWKIIRHKTSLLHYFSPFKYDQLGKLKLKMPISAFMYNILTNYSTVFLSSQHMTASALLRVPFVI